MAIRTYKVTLDSKNTLAPEPVYLRQGDKTGAVVIDATLMDNGSPVSLSGLMPMFKANTADGQAVIADSTGFNIVNASGGEFTYQVPNALSAVPGKIVTAYFSFSDASGSESTFDVAFIIKKAVDVTKPQADDYITIVDGTLKTLQQKIDAMNTDVQTIIDAFNQGDFYNKSQTDSKDAATLTSAKSYADSGDSTTLTSAKAYTYNSLKGVSSVPETFKNLNALKNAYPSGKNGLFVTADNGHKYIYYDGIWNDAGVYQSVGLAEDSVTDNQLTAGSRDVMSSLNFDATKSAFADKFPRSVYLKIESGGLTASNGNENVSDFSVRSGFIAFEKSKITLINRGGNFQFQLLQYNADRTFKTLVFGWKSNEIVSYTIDTSYLYRIAIANVGASTAINIDDAKTKFLITYTDEKLTYDLTNIDLINQSVVTINGSSTPTFAETSTAFELIITLATTEMSYWNGDSSKQATAPANTRGQSYTLSNYQSLVWDTTANSIYVSNGPFNSGTILLAKNVYGVVQSGYFQKYYDQASIERRINQQPSSYWDTYLDEKITEIQQAEQDLVTGDAFIFITDVHWGDNKKRSPALIEQIKQKTGVQKVFFGGDVPVAYGTSDKMMSDVLDFNNQFRQFKRQRDMYSVMGNHDFTIKTSATDDTGTTLPVSESYALFGREFERYTNIEQNKMYYYVDNSATKIRYIFINTEESVDTTVAWGVQAKISQEQEDWLTNEALNVEDGWKIIAIGHVPIHPDASLYSSKLDILKQTFDGYNARTKLDITSVDGVTATTDYTNAGGEVVAYLCGHNHKDQSFTDQGINYISTGCDANYKNDTWNRTSRTTSEQLFDVFFYDTTKNNLKTIRIGAGEDRNWETLA